MNNNNFICQYHCLLSTNQCYYCHSQDIFSSSYRCCSCSIPIEEILTWIIICSLACLLYNTIKLCIITFLILSIIYWIYKYTEIPRLFNEFYQKQLNSKSLIDEQQSNDDISDTNNISPDEDNQELNENDQNNLSTNVDTNTTSNNDFSKANNCDDTIMKTTEKSNRNLNEKKTFHPSTTKKLLIENTQNQEAFPSNNSIAQPGYYGPIHTIRNNTEESLSKISETLSANKQIEQKSKVQSQIFIHLSETSIVPDKHSIDEVIKQTEDIRQMIEALHDDILQLKTNSNEETIDNISNLSLEEQSILKLATENLIQVIMSTRNDHKLNRPSEERINLFEQLKKAKIVKHNEKQESSHSTFDDNHPQSEEINSTHTNRISKDSAVASNEPQFQHPKCITVQTSFALHSNMPRVPTKATVIANNQDDEDEKSYDDFIKTPQHIITTNEQFENILSKDKRKSENATFLKQDSIPYNNEQPDWAYYSSKPDLFPNINQSDLPIVQFEDQHSSFKQTFLSRFHHRPKFTSTNNPSTLHSSSINASNNLSSISSHSNELNLQNNINANDHCVTTVQKLLNHRVLNHLTQRIFRVRKSRIIISFDDTQQQKYDGDDDKHDLNSLVNTVVHDISKEINQTCSNNEQQTKIITNNSIVSLFQSFDSAIQEGELLIFNDKSFYQDNSENEDSLSEISNSLYSVTSQLILV